MENHQNFVHEKFGYVSKFIPEGSKVLDIGCNNGEFRNFLKNPSYYGVDVDKDLVSALVKKGIKAKQADLNKNDLPFKNEKFDFVLMLDVLEHVANPQKLLLEAKNRLNKEGKVITSLPNDYHLLNKLRFIFNRHITSDPFAPFGHLHYFPIKSGEKFLKNNGFEILNATYLTPIRMKFLTFLFPQALVRDVLYVLKQKN